MKIDTTKISMILLFVIVGLTTCNIFADLIAYDPFVNANVGNGENDKSGGEYNAGSQFRDFTNGNNIDVAGGDIVGFSAVNAWEGNSGASTGVFNHVIGPTDTQGLSFGINEVSGGNVQMRGYETTGVYYARRMLDAYPASNVYYTSMLVRADNLSDNLNIRAMTGFTVTVSYGAFDGSSTFPGIMAGFWGDGSKVDLVVRHRDEDSLMVNEVILSDVSGNTTYFVVAKIEYDAFGGSEQLTVWVNPQTSQEATASAQLITTGKILTNQTQMNYAGFWLENFNSDIGDYVQFDELRLATQWEDAVPVPENIVTVSQMTVSDYERPDYAPKYSDVCFSSRWLRGEGYQENVKWWGTLGTSEEIPMDSFEAMKMYHATRLEWIYLYGDEIDFISKVRAEGLSVSFAQTNNLKDEPGGVGTSLLGKIVDEDGNYHKNSFDNLMGCANNEVFKQTFLREAKSRIDAGADSIQLDDPVLNDDIACWCEYCNGSKDGFESTTEFYQWLHGQLDAYYYQQYGISKFPIHGNNSSHTVYSDSFFSVSDDYRLDYGCCETNIQDVSAQHFHNIGQNMRTYQNVSRSQIMTSPGTWGYSDPVYLADFSKTVRRSIGNSYAQGINMLAPFDRFGTDLADGGDQNQASRFFGDPQNFSDMFGFIRGIAIYLDGYEFAWDWGATTKAVYHVPDTPYSDTWGTAPGINEPVAAVDNGIAVVVRAKPGENDEPVAIHLIDWDKEASFSLTLNNIKFFGDGSDDLRLTLLEPVDNYNADDYEASWQNLSYTCYVKTTVLSGSFANGQTAVAIPELSPWAVLMVSKGKQTALPLNESSRWQQLRDNAPAYAVEYYPTNNELVTAMQSIMLSFDKELDSATLNSGIAVRHIESDQNISGSWSKLGSLARFTPDNAYPKGTISVELTPSLKRLNGVGSLRQKFYYNCELNIADNNSDLSVDLLDIQTIAQGWLSYSSTGDIDGDGYVGQNDLESYIENWLTCYVQKAEPLFPADNALDTSTQPLIRWLDIADSYDIYFGIDEIAVEHAGYDSLEFVSNTIDNEFKSELLQAGSTYYWRVDSISDGCCQKGDVFSFTTTTNETLCYWELDSDGSDAIGAYSFRALLGSVAIDTANYAVIANSDDTLPWNSSSDSSENLASLYFDGQSAVVNNVPASPFQFRRSSPFTCEAYIRPTDSSSVSGIIFGTRDGFSGYTGWALKYDSAYERISFALDHPGGSFVVRSQSGTFEIGQFKHVALVWDPSAAIGGEVRGYIDGVLAFQADARDYWDDSSLCGWNLMVGGRNLQTNPWAFIGQIDEMRWSNYPLTPSEFLNYSVN
ncbi:MAG: LamG domain-containing protein [Sedimentisphaeraceae bacterium JB056]